MSGEAGFIAALLSEPDDRTTLLVYADWLDDRGDPRAEYLRLLAAEKADESQVEEIRSRLAELRIRLDLGWVTLIGSRSFGPGCRVKWGGDPGLIFDFTPIVAERPGATVRLSIRHQFRVLDFGWWELEVLPR
jgi:uncharacterized protein (TIGR02996 family)